jgi:hypothetical protein
LEKKTNLKIWKKRLRKNRMKNLEKIEMKNLEKIEKIKKIKN